MDPPPPPPNLSPTSPLGKNKTTPIYNPAHPSTISNYLTNCFSDSPSFTDVTLHIQSVSFKAHRIVLSHYSPFFSELFSGMGGNLNHFDVFLEGFSAPEVERILEFMYTGTIDIRSRGGGGGDELDQEDHHHDFFRRICSVAEVLQVAQILELLQQEVKLGRTKATSSSPIGIWQKVNVKFEEEEEEEMEEELLDGSFHEEEEDDLVDEKKRGSDSSAAGKRRKQARPKRHTPSPTLPVDLSEDNLEDQLLEEPFSDENDSHCYSSCGEEELLREGEDLDPDLDPEPNPEEEEEDIPHNQARSSPLQDLRKPTSIPPNLSSPPPNPQQLHPTHNHGHPSPQHHPQLPPPHYLFLRNIMNSGGGGLSPVGPPPGFYPPHHPHPHHGPPPSGKRLMQKNLWGKMILGGGGGGGGAGGGKGFHHHHPHGSSRAQHSAPRGGPPRAWSNQDLTEALHNVWNKKMTTSQASRIFGIPYNSLLMYVRGKYGKSLKLDLLKKGLDLALLEKQKLNSKSSSSSASISNNNNNSRGGSVTTTPPPPQPPPASSSSRNNSNSNNSIPPHQPPPPPQPISLNKLNNNVVEWMMMNSNGGKSGPFSHPSPHSLFFGGGGFIGEGNAGAK